MHFIGRSAFTALVFVGVAVAASNLTTIQLPTSLRDPRGRSMTIANDKGR
jgi:hypothetical protein